jgi:hypothetical protein
MGRLRRACVVVELDELPRHALNVPGVQEDEVVERIFAQRTMKSLVRSATKLTHSSLEN